MSRPLGTATAQHQGNPGPFGLGRRHEWQACQQNQKQVGPSPTKDAHMIFH